MHDAPCPDRRENPRANNDLPAPGETVVVQCADFRCLAYRDLNGTWKDACSHKALPEVLAILPM